MTVFLVIANPFTQSLNQSQIERCALETLNHQKIRADIDLTIMIDDDARIQQLNREFLNIDAPTDVLAFPAGHLDPDTQRVYLGDVIISYPQAKKQAALAGHSLSAEINLLVIHGVLHLLGHDHDEVEGGEIMWSAQHEILTNLGSKINSPQFTTDSDD
jgi:probable rRNA maturation factor